MVKYIVLFHSLHTKMKSRYTFYHTLYAHTQVLHFYYGYLFNLTHSFCGIFCAISINNRLFLNLTESGKKKFKMLVTMSHREYGILSDQVFFVYFSLSLHRGYCLFENDSEQNFYCCFII